MCGIAGFFNSELADLSAQRNTLEAMLRRIAHRGPDEAGIFLAPGLAMGAVRLSIVDLQGGSQPIGNETGEIFVSFNGEIFNHPELRAMLEGKGHLFSTHADTEVLIHLYEEYGLDFLKQLNGQFAFALWDGRKKNLILARDRPGIRPLFFTQLGKTFVFGSEIKSLFTYPQVRRTIDPAGLDQILTFWTTVGETTFFEGIHELPPAHFLIVSANQPPRMERYWDCDFPIPSTPPAQTEDIDEAACRLKESLLESVRLQLRADVPVGVYLSGGIDSSVITSLVSQCQPGRFKTFSVQFEDPQLDESDYQQEMVSMHKTDHHFIRCGPSDVGAVFPEIVWHTEKPVFRTAPGPLFLLSKLTRENGIKVVLTGEGADEMLWGYDTFKEQKIREFWRRFPNSSRRPLLLKKLFPYLSHYRDDRYFQLLRMFYQSDLSSADLRAYSHLPRWRNNTALKSFYSPEFRARVGENSSRQAMEKCLPPDFDRWNSLERNQYLETLTLMPGYLLASQGDRMAMAHGVEGRFPFLDHHVISFCASLPGNLKMRRLCDKFLLRQAFKRELPPKIFERSKRAYMSPDAVSFIQPSAQAYMEEVVSETAIRRAGIFDWKTVQRHLAKVKATPAQNLTYRDNMAMVVLVSAQLAHHLFVEKFPLQESGKLPKIAKEICLQRI
ncbi:MAG: asparagine synthase (glutamine-hydrolyzing) [Verrucomicrobiae bacterium]|nr:asparagine synthase (glutamine-hydrolyzing) [Verrucomicrobiae bacterium]